MDAVQRELFGTFPRRVGTPSQHWVFNQAQVEVFLDGAEGTYNPYATMSRLDPVWDTENSAFRATCDKVLFDLDGDKEAFPDGVKTDDEKVAAMRGDPDVADAVLGEACEDAQELVRASHDDGIPVLGVFSGLGIHVHQLYKPTRDPKVAMTTCAAKYIEELDLQTADWKVVGDPPRICRIPNCRRVTMPGPDHHIEPGRPTGVWTVPLTGDELRSVDPQTLLALSTEPRVPDELYTRERPQMPVWEEYKDGVEKADLPAQPLDQRTADLDEDWVEDLLWDLVQMPCVVERLLQPNPEHIIRFQGAVLLFSVGLEPNDVLGIFGSLGWVDYDPTVTGKHLNHIYENRYSDMSCRSLREERLCTRQEEPSSCSCHGWSGGDGTPQW